MSLKKIPLEECVDRHIYRIHARNFSVGVFNEEAGGFIGIREKFGSEYLSTEYHCDYSTHLGSATPYEDLGKIEDDRIKLWERYPGAMCGFCGEDVVTFSQMEDVELAESLKSQGYVRSHVNHELNDTCGKPSPWTKGSYRPLFRLLADIINALEYEDYQEDVTGILAYKEGEER